MQGLALRAVLGLGDRAGCGEGEVEALEGGREDEQESWLER